MNLPHRLAVLAHVAAVAGSYSVQLAAVAERLNAEGHRNRSGRAWSAQMVHHVLKSAPSR